MLKGKCVVLGVTGSIAAYKIAYLASALFSPRDMRVGCDKHSPATVRISSDNRDPLSTTDIQHLLTKSLSTQRSLTASGTIFLMVTSSVQNAVGVTIYSGTGIKNSHGVIISVLISSCHGTFGTGFLQDRQLRGVTDDAAVFAGNDPLMPPKVNYSAIITL